MPRTIRKLLCCFTTAKTTQEGTSAARTASEAFPSPQIPTASQAMSHPDLENHSCTKREESKLSQPRAKQPFSSGTSQRKYSDPDAVSPVTPQQDHRLANVKDALEDRKKLFVRLRRPNQTTPTMAHGQASPEVQRVEPETQA